MKRGEIWVGAGRRGYASKPRPWLIIQDNQFVSPSITACGLTSADRSALPLLSVPVDADQVSGLDVPSWVMIDKINTFRRTQVTQLVGRLTARQLTDVERLLLAFLGIA